jgi:hypothetical protein
MRIRQRAYFGIWSSLFTPPEITGRLLVEPDEMRFRGSTKAGPPPFPRLHSWCLRSGITEEAELERHFEALEPRIAAVKDGVWALLNNDDDAIARLAIVRYFSEGDEDFDEETYGLSEAEIEKGWRRLSGQHPFLGFVIAPQMLNLLHHIGAFVDVDEYR